MIERNSHGVPETATRDSAASSAEVCAARRALASAIKDRWITDCRADAAAALRDHPELNSSKSIALDLAYEEYCQRREAGEAIDPEAFADRFASFRHTLRRLLSIHSCLSAPAGSKAIPVLLPGQRYLDFRILDELGRGAFATVYLAEQVTVGNRLVAIKVAAEAADEANLLGKLSHPNIVPIHFVARDPATGCAVICMPYAGRATLCDVLDVVFASDPPRLQAAVAQQATQPAGLQPGPDRSSTPGRAGGSYLDAVLRIGVQLADALAHAHAQGIVHRDLKPSNVLIDFAGRPLILDFNLSSDAASELASLGGTLPYMPPEQAAAIVAGRPDDTTVDARSDVFALGAILYELLCGEPPLHTGCEPLSATNLDAHLAAWRAIDLAAVRRAAVIRDEPVLRIVARCLSFDPAERPQTAAELRQLLEGQLSAARRLGRWGAAHRPAVTCGVALLMAVAAFCGYAVATRDPYPVRELQAALADVDDGRLAEAGERLNALVRADKTFWEARLARARWYAQSGEVSLAFDDYNALHQHQPTALTAACKGYCMGMLSHHDAAITFDEEAIRTGLASPAVLSNLGWSLSKLSRLPEARSHLSRALEENADFQPALLNRGTVGVQESFAADAAIPAALADLQRAIELGPISGELYLDLAMLYAIQTRQGADASEQVARNLQLAIDNGLDPAGIAKNPMFTRIADKLDLQPFINQQRRNPQRLIGIHLVNPDPH